MSGFSERDLELQVLFESYALTDERENRLVNVDQLEDLLQDCGQNFSNFRLRSWKLEFIRKHGSRLNFNEFLTLLEEISEKDVGHSYKQALEHPSGIRQLDGANSEIKHSFSDSERIAFTEWINAELNADLDLKGHLPISQQEHEGLSEAVKDGLVLCKLVNWAVPGTIRDKDINKGKLNLYTIYENQTKVLEGAKSIGCNIVNIGAADLNEGRLHLVMGLIWQVIRIGLSKQVSVKSSENLHHLAAPGESVEDLTKLSLEQTIQRWVNHNLKYIGHNRKINNLSSDLMDSEVYSVLLYKLAPPNVDITSPSDVLAEPDLFNRAEIVLSNAKKLECSSFLSPADIVHGNQKLNLTFLCNILNKFPEIEPAVGSNNLQKAASDRSTSTSDINHIQLEENTVKENKILVDDSGDEISDDDIWDKSNVSYSSEDTVIEVGAEDNQNISQALSNDNLKTPHYQKDRQNESKHSPKEISSVVLDIKKESFYTASELKHDENFDMFLSRRDLSKKDPDQRLHPVLEHKSPDVETTVECTFKDNVETGARRNASETTVWMSPQTLKETDDQNIKREVNIDYSTDSISKITKNAQEIPSSGNRKNIMEKHWIFNIFELSMDWLFRSQHPLLYFAIIHGVYLAIKLKHGTS